MVETELVGKNGFTCSWRSHDEIRSTFEEAAMEDTIQSGNTARDTLKRWGGLIRKLAHERSLLLHSFSMVSCFCAVYSIILICTVQALSIIGCVDYDAATN
jgi:hypothetical protein